MPEQPTIYVNGKKKVTLAINDKSFDGITVSFAPKTDAVMWFDDVQICNIIDHDDYPSYPQVAESKDYNIGVNVCWLWRDQHSGEGWDSVSSFPEFEPYIGYYDEGLRETADWELKWLAEHGVDFMHACWYCPSANVKEPIKKMRHSYYALHDGYMMAKYSDLVDFCIMWENNGQDCHVIRTVRVTSGTIGWNITSPIRVMRVLTTRRFSRFGTGATLKRPSAAQRARARLLNS